MTIKLTKQKNNLITNDNLNQSFKKFFFPFWPIKYFKSMRLICLTAILISLKIILSFVSIKIPLFGITISITWIPIMVLGWFFGPIIGLILGILTDSLSFLLNGGVWFWMYFIQEPIICLISGILGGICTIRKNKKILIDIFINQIIVISFAIISFIIIILWSEPYINIKDNIKNFSYQCQIFRIIDIIFLTLFFLTNEIFLFLNLINKKVNFIEKNNFITYLYTNCCVIIIITLFSFILGPTTIIHYLKFLGLRLPDSYYKIGLIFYLFPRVCIESIKVPIESLIFFSVVILIDFKMNLVIQKINASWKA